MLSVQQKALQIAIQIHVPAVIWGSSGIGKSASFRALGAPLGAAVVVEPLASKEPSDFTGLPVVIDGVVRFVPTAWAKNVQKLAKENLWVLVVLDELNRVYPMVQNAALAVISDHRIGEEILPANVSFAVAANPPGQGNSAVELDIALANRFIHITWRASAKVWTEGMLSGWQNIEVLKVPVNWREQYYADAVKLVTDFITAVPSALENEPTEATPQNRAWPSPRTWDYATQLLAAAFAVHAEPALMREVIKSAVGDATTKEFWQWYTKRNLLAPEVVLENPLGIELPGKSYQLFMLVDAIIDAVRTNATEYRYAQAWKLLERIANEGKKEVSAGVAIPLARLGRQHQFPPPKNIQLFADTIQRITAELESEE